MSESVKVTNGENGGVIVSTTALTKTPYNTPWRSLQMLSDTVFAALEGNLTGYVGVTIPKGTVLKGKFTSLTLASGSLVAYVR